MKLWMIRHLPTAWNQQGRLQGRQDIDLLPINDDARRQVQDNLARLRAVDFDVVLTSTLSRTRQTAALYGFQSPVVEPLLDEFDFGRYEGRPKVELLKDIGDLWEKRFLDVQIGETGMAFQRRLLLFIEKYKSSPEVLIFGHGAIIRGLTTIADERSFNEINQMHVLNNQLIIRVIDVGNLSLKGSAPGVDQK